MKTPIYYQQGGGDEQYTPRYGVEVLLPHIQHLFKQQIILQEIKIKSEIITK